MGSGYGELSQPSLVRASARVAGHTRKWDEAMRRLLSVIICLRLRLASRVCTDGAERGISLRYSAVLVRWTG
jgi:hypothetical protein